MLCCVCALWLAPSSHPLAERLRRHPSRAASATAAPRSHRAEPTARDSSEPPEGPEARGTRSPITSYERRSILRIMEVDLFKADRPQCQELEKPKYLELTVSM